MSDTTNELGYVPPSLTYTTQHKEWLPEPQPKLDVELLPCPFCGEMPVIHYHNNYVEIYCDCDDCLMDEVKVERDGFDLQLDETEAVAAWNTRYYPPEVVAALQFYYKDDLNSVEEGILESVDKRPAARALRAMGLLPKGSDGATHE